MLEKTKSFVFGAGKIILALSIVLWFLASNGSELYENANAIVKKESVNLELSEDELNQKISSYKLEHSYIGMAGKMIEPAIKPLGCDWKIAVGRLHVGGIWNAEIGLRIAVLGRRNGVRPCGSDPPIHMSREFKMM